MSVLEIEKTICNVQERVRLEAVLSLSLYLLLSLSLSLSVSVQDSL
jgi:hypothetical protein